MKEVVPVEESEAKKDHVVEEEEKADDVVLDFDDDREGDKFDPEIEQQRLREEVTVF